MFAMFLCSKEWRKDYRFVCWCLYSQRDREINYLHLYSPVPKEKRLRLLICVWTYLSMEAEKRNYSPVFMFTGSWKRNKRLLTWLHESVKRLCSPVCVCVAVIFWLITCGCNLKTNARGSNQEFIWASSAQSSTVFMVIISYMSNFSSVGLLLFFCWLICISFDKCSWWGTTHFHNPSLL